MKDMASLKNFDSKILKQKALYLETHDSSARSALYIFTDPYVNSLKDNTTDTKEIYFTSSKIGSDHLTPWHSLICSFREGSFLRSRRQIQHWDRIEPTFPMNNLVKLAHTKGSGVRG